MGTCKDCDTPNLCIAFRSAEDYLSPDGELRQIIGCDFEKFLYGDILSNGDIERIGKDNP